MGTHFNKTTTIRAFMILTLFSDSFLNSARDYLMANHIRRTKNDNNATGARAFNDDLSFLEGTSNETQLTFEDKVLGFRELIDSMKGLKYSEESIADIIAKDGKWNRDVIKSMIRTTPYYDFAHINHSYDADSVWRAFKSASGNIDFTGDPSNQLAIINEERKAVGLLPLETSQSISNTDKTEPIKNIIAPNPKIADSNITDAVVVEDNQNPAIVTDNQSSNRAFNFLEMLAIVGSVQRKIMTKTDMMESLGYKL